MGKKILFAVMALLVMATGKIWAQDTAEKKAYAVLCPNGTDDQNNATYSMHFVYTTATEKTIEGGKTEKTVDVTINSTTTPITLTEKNHWEINPANTWLPAWYSATEKAKITEVVFEESFKDVKVKSCWNWFEGFTSLAKIKDIENLDTSEVTDMSSMFNSCNKLESLDLSSFNTSNVTNMNSMFDGCCGLTTLTLSSSFVTSQVTDMGNMFGGCQALTSLDLSSFNTSGAANTIFMFQDCSSLGQITFGNNFKTSNTKSMFQGCNSLTTLDLSSFDTSSVTNMGYMFKGCSGLTTLTLSNNFDTSSVTNMVNMFEGCSSLTELDISNFKTSSVESISGMFRDCTSLTKLFLCNFGQNIRETDIENMFDNCGNLRELDLSQIENETILYKIVVKLPISNSVIYVKTKAEVSEIRKNMVIVVSGICQNFMIDANNLTSLNFPSEFTANNVTFTRTFTAGKPHTVCLPFAVDATKYGTFYTFKEYKDNKVIFKKLPADKTTAKYAISLYTKR